MPQGNYETPDPITKKAIKHQQAALKGKGNDLSNAEIKPKIDPITKRNKELSIELHEIMFDRIGGNAGYRSFTEYHVGISCINEELHCIFGSTMKSIGAQPFITGDLGHIDEELDLIENDIIEYQKDIKPYAFDNDEKTVANANRVLNLLDIVDIKLLQIEERTERDEVAVELASKSAILMRKIALLIIRYPSPQYTDPTFKPFGLIKNDVKDLRNYFETEYAPKFPR